MDIIPQIGLTICGLLSLISTAALILIYAIKRSSRTYGFRLVLPLFVFDSLWSFNIVLPTLYLYIDPNAIIYPSLCRIQGTIKLFSMLGSFFSTVAISWSLYTFIIRRKPIKSKNPTEYFAKYTILLPLFLSIIPLALDRYDQLKPLSNVMCFLCLREEDGSTDYIGIMLRVFLYYIPFSLVLIFDMFSVFRIFYYFHKNKIDYHDQKDIKNLMLYPIVLFFSWIWIIIERVTEVIKNEDVGWLNNMDLALATLNGFLNALVYGYISLDPFQFFRKKGTQESSIDDTSQLVSSYQEPDTTTNINVVDRRDESDLLQRLSKQSKDYSLTFHINSDNDDNQSDC